MKGANRWRIRCVIAMILISISLSGCRNDSAISNQIVVTGIGITENGQQFELSVQAIESLKTSGSLSEQDENATSVYRASGKSVAKALHAFLNEAGRSTYILHNQVIALKGDRYRDRSVFDTLDYFMRNLEGRTLVDLVFCRDDPAKLLSVSSGNDAIPSEYISQLIQEGYEWGVCVKTAMVDAQRSFSGMYDMMMPIIKMEGERPKLDGTALFRGGYFAGELTPAQTAGIRFAANDMKKGLYIIEGVTFCLDSSSTKLSVEKTDDAYRYQFSITGKAYIEEIDTMSVMTKQRKEVLLSLLNDEISSNTEEAIKLAVLQYRSDPLALARRTAKTYTNTTAKEVAGVLKRCEYVVNSNIELIEKGFLS